jgi:hypothetical protein
LVLVQLTLQIASSCAFSLFARCRNDICTNSLIQYFMSCTTHAQPTRDEWRVEIDATANRSESCPLQRLDFDLDCRVATGVFSCANVVKTRRSASPGQTCQRSVPASPCCHSFTVDCTVCALYETFVFGPRSAPGRSNLASIVFHVLAACRASPNVRPARG